MKIINNTSLKSFNTFGIEVFAKHFTEIKAINEIEEAIDYSQKKSTPFLIIGGGSNILFTKDFDGLVIKNNLKSIELIREDDEFYYVKAAAGEVWHHLVLYCIENNFSGIENLSLIPGSVGAAPLQNIGAYGVELKNVFYELEALNIHKKEIEIFDLNSCAFDYRESIFKTELKNQYVILNITIKLKKQPQYNIEYGAIKDELEKMNCSNINAKTISQAVINIRTSKLPNPAEIGNAGSFFKNPIVSEALCQQLKIEFQSIPIYPSKNNQFKIAAGWLIEQCGWKGYRKNDYGCHAKQALVLVNYGNASGKEIFDLSTSIKESVQQKFGIELEREVNIV
jgi:UDP-N-acetylmuramate dehydrogenase